MHNIEQFPIVTALLVTRNEKQYICESLMSLVNQSYPKEKYEIIVIDGESTDGTVDFINEIIKKYLMESIRIKLLNNPKHILSSGWNIGIRHALGEYVIRIDAHAKAPVDFIEKNVETILYADNKVACVGGKLISKSVNGDDIISKVLSSPFGVGNSSFRVSETAGYADTAVYGLYRKEIFDEVGYFNESYKRNQDIEMHARIKRHGWQFYFNPEIECVYYTRNSTKKMMKQAFGNGKWNMVLLKNAGAALSIRHIVPFAFVLYLIFSIFAGIIWHSIWLIASGVLILYFILGLLAASGKTQNVNEILLMPFLFLLLHTSYGSGYFFGIFTDVR